MKNMRKSVLALTLLVTASQASWSIPTIDFSTISRPEVSIRNGAIAAGVIAAGAVSYKYRNAIKNAIVTSANAAKNGAITIKNVVMRNKLKTAGAVLVAVVLGYAYKAYKAQAALTEVKPEQPTKDVQPSTTKTDVTTGDTPQTPGTGIETTPTGDANTLNIPTQTEAPVEKIVSKTTVEVDTTTDANAGK